MAGRPKIVVDNTRVKSYLEGWVVLSLAPQWVDDVLTGCSHMEMSGAERMLSKKTLFQILMFLDEISVDSVVEYGYSRKYAEKLALILRVASSNIDKMIEKEKI